MCCQFLPQLEGFEISSTALTASRYKNQAAVQAHLKAPYFRKFSAKLPELLAKPVELRSGTLLEGSCVVSRL